MMRSPQTTHFQLIINGDRSRQATTFTRPTEFDFFG